MNYPNLLVISNNSLSNNNSNGRTLAGFLHGWDKNNIAQIYVTGETPQSEVCDNFFRITDKDVIKGFLHRNNIGGRVKNSPSADMTKPSGKKIKKTVFTISARDMIWNTGIWFGKKLKNWLDEFNPQLILFFAGESTFTFNIALKLSKAYNLPIVLYNSEGYYFKDRNYLKDSGASALMYPLFHKKYVKTFNRFMKNVSSAVYINGKLENDYNKFFDVPSEVIYTSTGIKNTPSRQRNTTPRISYLGNLGIGRHKSLCEIADTLQEINEDYKIDVYGSIPNDEVQKAFEGCAGINYKGFVSYAEVVKIMQESDLLIHAESFDDFYRWDLQYGFTTKIADSLASGVCFFVYAPEELACTEYLKDITCTVTEKSDLKEKLYEILENEELREKYISAGLKAVEKNHRMDKNCERFQNVLLNAAGEKG